MRLFQGIVSIRIYKGITFKACTFTFEHHSKLRLDKECLICDKVLCTTRSIIVIMDYQAEFQNHNWLVETDAMDGSQKKNKFKEMLVPK